MFLIKEGRCVVVVDVDGEEVQVAERKEGEFVGEMGVKLTNSAEVADGDAGKETSNGDDDSPHSPTTKEARNSTGVEKTVNVMSLLRVKNAWVGGRRGADVRAATDMKVMVMNGAQMQWILEHDYGADGELSQQIVERKLQMQKSMSVKR